MENVSIRKTLVEPHLIPAAARNEFDLFPLRSPYGKNFKGSKMHADQ